MPRQSQPAVLTRGWCALATGAALVLAACSAEPDAAAPSGTSDDVPGVTAGSGSPSPSARAPEVDVEVAEMVVTAREDIATDLSAPWAIAFEPGGTLLVTERDEGRILRVEPGGSMTPLTGAGADTLAQTDSSGEAGLLGIALLPDDPSVLYAYVTRTDGNAVERMDLGGETLGATEDIVTGIPKAVNHDGGRIAFGPDGHLYVATGDAAVPELAQDRTILHGTILRVVADGPGGDEDGAPAPGNPFEDLVWSYGHRNVQGLGWAPDGTMVASEFGQSDADELNVIEPGGNYGWPEVEGLIGAPEGTALGDTVDGLTYPAAEWRPTASASPSGIAVTDEGVYVAALRGRALFRVPFTAEGLGEPQVLVDDLGRIRDVVHGPDGALYVMTNNTDGRGDPRSGDDRIVRMEIAPAG